MRLIIEEKIVRLIEYATNESLLVIIVCFWGSAHAKRKFDLTSTTGGVIASFSIL